MEVASGSRRINILINLSSRLLCEGLQGLMEQKPATYRTLLAHDPEYIRDFTPHKILVDAATLEQPFPKQWNEAKVILIDTGLREGEVIRLLLQYRLDGVISTITDTELFWKALETIHSGQVWIDNGKIRSLLHNPHPPCNTSAQENFSRRERQIVLLIAEGQKNREIAVQLSISEQTVKTHLGRIFKKAKVTSRAQLAPLALKFKMDVPPLHA